MTEIHSDPSTSGPSKVPPQQQRTPRIGDRGVGLYPQPFPVTGEEPLTDAQASYLVNLTQDTSREIGDSPTKAQASELIDQLQAASPRVSGASSETPKPG
jgi:hypothetical protein